MMSDLRRKAATLGIGDLVEFRGAVADVASELDASDIVVLFSAGEGSPNTVLETIARGRIPLARRAAGTVGSVPSVLERCLVDSGSPEAFAERVQEILDGPDEFLAGVRAAREALRRRQAVFESAMGRLYEDALHRRRGDGRVRVLHLITRLIVGGAQENTIASVERVDPGKYDSHLWCGPQTGLEGSLFQDARERGESPRVLPNLVREISPLRDLAVTLELTRLLRRERFDIVHTHCSKAGIVGRVAARMAGVPHITHTHHGLSFHDRMNPVLRRFFIALERMMAAWTHPMISVSERTTSVGLSAGVGRPEDYRLIRSGIPLTTFGPDAERGAAVRRELGIAEGEVVVGSVGRLTAQKNPLDFVELASGVLASHRNATFLYVGDGPLMDAVAEVIAERGLAERVRLLGLRTDVPDLLRAMDIFVLTSLWEGLPRVVLQALATGLPVVAYDTAGIMEAVEEGRNGYLVATGDVARMVEHAVRLVSDAELRGRMGEAARELDHAFSEEGMIRDLEALYNEMTSGGAAGGERAPGLRGAVREGQSGVSS
jgi:glycosyltransferase involved in cell wall biosynthesis